MRGRFWLLAAALLTVSACGGEGDPDVATTTPPATTAPATASPTPTVAPPSPTPTDDVTVVEIVIADGEVEGGVADAEVELGGTVRLEVTSDTADHVHVHGYDLFQDVTPGETAVLEFTADIPGVFEIELEDQHFKIADLTVRG